MDIQDFVNKILTEVVKDSAFDSTTSHLRFEDYNNAALHQINKYENLIQDWYFLDNELKVENLQKELSYWKSELERLGMPKFNKVSKPLTQEQLQLLQNQSEEKKGKKVRIYLKKSYKENFVALCVVKYLTKKIVELSGKKEGVAVMALFLRVTQPYLRRKTEVNEFGKSCGFNISDTKINSHFYTNWLNIDNGKPEKNPCLKEGTFEKVTELLENFEGDKELAIKELNKLKKKYKIS